MNVDAREHVNKTLLSYIIKRVRPNAEEQFSLKMHNMNTRTNSGNQFVANSVIIYDELITLSKPTLYYNASALFSEVYRHIYAYK